MGVKIVVGSLENVHPCKGSLAPKGLRTPDLQGASGIQNRSVGSDELIKRSGGASIRGRATSGGEAGKGHEVVVLMYSTSKVLKNELKEGVWCWRICCWLTGASNGLFCLFCRF